MLLASIACSGARSAVVAFHYLSFHFGIVSCLRRWVVGTALSLDRVIVLGGRSVSARTGDVERWAKGYSVDGKADGNDQMEQARRLHLHDNPLHLGRHPT